MTPKALLAELRSRGVELLLHDGRLKLRGPAERITPELVRWARQHKLALLACLRGERSRAVTPDSRNPLIEPAIRVKIEAIEAEARTLGWPPELLWSCNFWDLPRGLAAILEPADEITQVASDRIEILKTKRDLLVFRRHTA
jgi:hypothetical protein